jgi:hypothetical protein
MDSPDECTDIRFRENLFGLWTPPTEIRQWRLSRPKARIAAGLGLFLP